MERILQLVENVPKLPRERIDWLVNHTGRVDKLSFQAVTILLTILAILASSARMLFRYHSHRSLSLEDSLIVFATICLIVETGLILSYTRNLYNIDGATLNLDVLAFFTRDPNLQNALFDSGPSILIAYMTLGWLAVFAVKYSFLALFYKMCRNVSRKLTAWFWCTVAATGMSLVVVMLESFILCPQFGANAAQCFMKSQYTFSIGSGVVVQSLDIATDLMIISIPLTLLKMSHLKLQNKFRIAIVLCLSSICVLLSIIRLAAGIHRNVFGKWQFGTAWLSFMLHSEAAVAVMAGSVPALRAIYTSWRSQKIEARFKEGTECFKGKTEKILGGILDEAVPKPRLDKSQCRMQRASIAKLRQSVVGIIPRRMGSKKGDLEAGNANEKAESRAESPVPHSGDAYHEFKKQEREREMVQVVINSPASSHTTWHKHKSVDMSEAISQEGTVVSEPSSPDLSSQLAMPKRTMSVRRVEAFINTQFRPSRQQLKSR